MRFTRYLKKFALFSATFTVAFLSTSNTWAAEISTANMERYLQNIQNYTYKILSTINDFPVYLTNTSMLALSWLKPDDSDATATMQGNFTTLGNIFATNLSAQTDRDLQLRLTANLLGITNIADLTNPPDSPKVLTTIPNINDITYTSLVGSPPIAKNASTAPYNYILNAGGLNITHGYLPNKKISIMRAQN